MAARAVDSRCTVGDSDACAFRPRSVHRRASSIGRSTRRVRRVPTRMRRRPETSDGGSQRRESHRFEPSCEGGTREWMEEQTSATVSHGWPSTPALTSFCCCFAHRSRSTLFSISDPSHPSVVCSLLRSTSEVSRDADHQRRERSRAMARSSRAARSPSRRGLSVCACDSICPWLIWNLVLSCRAPPSRPPCSVSSPPVRAISFRSLPSAEAALAHPHQSLTPAARPHAPHAHWPLPAVVPSTRPPVV
jgi:hypothetical protein